MLADYHLHTSFSEDSNCSMEDYIKRALEIGVEELCFTDHIDYGTKYTFSCDCDKYYKNFIRYKEIFKDKINLKFGIEFGLQAHHIDYFQKIFEKYPFDFVILSFHLIDDKDLWSGEFQRGKTQDEYNRKYYEEMLKTVQLYKNYSVLGHMDLMRRYDSNGEYPFEKTKDIIESILKQIISDNKGIEVNTSSFRYKLNGLMPSVEILKFYYNLGGKIITIGSDSHNVNHLGYKINYIKDILKEIGFKEFVTYDKLEPKFWKL